MIRDLTGAERVIAFATQSRRYICRDCGYTFRAQDRRRGERRQGREYSEQKRNIRTGQINKILLEKGLATYRFAFVSVLAATILDEFTVLLNGRAPMSFFIIAVIVSAGHGVMTGLLATVLSLFVMVSMFRENLSIALATQNTLALFFAIGIVTNLVFYKIHLRNAALNRAKTELEAANQQLVDHAESLAQANARLEEQKLALFQAHEHLRLLSKRLTNNIHAPLRTISATAEMLVESNAARWDASVSRAPAELIKDEVRRMDTLVESFEHAC
jgi:hypothetical protein